MSARRTAAEPMGLHLLVLEVQAADDLSGAFASGRRFRGVRPRGRSLGPIVCFGDTIGSDGGIAGANRLI